MLLAKEYNLLPGFFAAEPTGMDLLLADHEILNRLIDADNKAQEEAMKKEQDKPALDSHPGLHGRLTVEELAERQAARGND